MRVPRIAGFLAMCLLLRSDQNLSGGEFFAVWYSARLRVSTRTELEQRLRAPFTEGIAHPAGVSNCVQLLARRGQARQEQQPDREFQMLRSTTAECLLLHELERATPARHSYVHDLMWDEHVLPVLPPELAISVSDEAKRAAHDAGVHGQNWTDFDSSITARARGTDAIVVTGRGFRERLILWGRGDFTGDGNEDLLVQSLDTLTEGTYRNARLFVLTRRTVNGRLSLVRLLL